MLLMLTDFLQANVYRGFGVFHYLTLRAILGALTALLISLWVGPALIRHLTIMKIGQNVRNDGPQTHLSKAGTPTMGGSLILLAVGISTLLWSDLHSRHMWVALLVTLGFGWLGFVDDWRKIKQKQSKGLSAKEKYFWQTLFGFAAAIYLYTSATLPVETTLIVPLAETPLSTTGTDGTRPSISAGVASGAARDWRVSLVDVARQAGLRVPTVYGGLERKRFIIETNGAGVALVDVDADGWLDVFLLNGTRLEEGTRRDRVWPRGEAPVSRLYLNRRDGTFRDVTRASGLGRTGWGSAVCVGDYDGDGRLDLFTTYFGDNVLYRNLGGARFENVTARAGLPTGGRRWGSGCAITRIVTPSTSFPTRQ